MPNILIIDDEADIQTALIRSLPSELGNCFTVRTPDDLIDRDLTDTQLILVDYKLDHWLSNNPTDGPSKYIPNGLALCAILQQRVIGNADHAIAFAIHSAHLPELTAPFPFEPRVHLLARMCNVDWAFAKSVVNGNPTTCEQAVCLADSVLALPKVWPITEPEKTRSEARRLLAIPQNEQWAEQAWIDVERAHPPLDELVQRIHGLLFLRWLLQRVLSYPCFLLDHHWLSARLGATPQSVLAALNNGGHLRSLLDPVRYQGILHEFRGHRWWRAGLEVVIWNLAGERSVDVRELHDLLRKNYDVTLEQSASSHPVVCVDDNFQPHELIDPSQAVRLQPDDWPSYADYPWVPIDQACKNPRLFGLVIEADRDRLLDFKGG